MIVARTNRQKSLFSTTITPGIVFLVIICFYTLFFIYPSYRSFCQTRQTTLEQTAKFERLKLLYPVFARSKTLGQVQFEHGLPFPPRKQIHWNELAKLSGKISDTAKRNHMTMYGNDFDINSLKNQSQSISMVIKLKGKLFDFRRFLIDIIAFEFFNSIEKFSIDTNMDQANMDQASVDQASVDQANMDQAKNFTLTLNIRIKK